MRIDLHTHSTASDGTEPPEQVVRAGAAAGLDVLALTDHDTTVGWEAAGHAGAQAGVTVVPGMELSCSFRGISLHVLAYLFDPAAEDLLAETTRSRESRETRLQAMAELLIEDGHLDSYEQVLEQVPAGATMGRPHLADAMVAAGRFASRDEAFADVLSSRSRYYVGHYAPSPVTAVQAIRAAGGVPVIAHPFADSRGRTVGEDVIEQMALAGLAGIEVDHRDHSPQARERAAALARRLGLLATGSSDYHGTGKPNRLGENTTSEGVLHAILELGTGSGLFGADLARRG